MKVLWICNIMLPVIARDLGVEGSNKEGWLSGLCDTLLERRSKNKIELHVAYPVQKEQDGSSQKIELPELGEDVSLYGYGFYEDVEHAEVPDPALDERIAGILDRVRPDVIHCFGTEYEHTYSVLRLCEKAAYRQYADCILVGLQGLCSVIAGAYMADLPEEVQRKVTFRDWLKKDSLRKQQEKFMLRGEREKELLQLARFVTGRTEFDRSYVENLNPQARYFSMNETLRSCFYEGCWEAAACESHTIFVSQGDYPLKGLHYLLLAAGELKEEFPDLKIKIAGNSLVNYRTLKDKIKISAYGQYLRRLIKKEQLESQVAFLGKLTAQEMKAQYLQAGLFVCCSANENSPNSLGEAMLLGVPCVAADVGGISSIFSGGVDGILYEGYEQKTEQKSVSNQPEQWIEQGLESRLNTVADNLKNAIAEAWKHPDAMQKRCENARIHAAKTHDKEENYRKLVEIYENMFCI